jgi:hypothetical protein
MSPPRIKILALYALAALMNLRKQRSEPCTSVTKNARVIVEWASFTKKPQLFAPINVFYLPEHFAVSSLSIKHQLPKKSERGESGTGNNFFPKRFIISLASSSPTVKTWSGRRE